jgi:NADH-quinone oxidoreductase subunit J
MNFPASNLIVSAIFLLCLATLGVGALIAVMSMRLIRSVCGLATCCIGLAGLYYFLNSPFLALMEILIYVGAVCVTIVFAIMLAEPDEPANDETHGKTVLWGGLAATATALLFGGLGWLGTHANWTAPPTLQNNGSVRAIGQSLLTTYSLGFELISLALLVAILGSLAIARMGRTKVTEQAKPEPNEILSRKPLSGNGAISQPRFTRTVRPAPVPEPEAEVLAESGAK